MISFGLGLLFQAHVVRQAALNGPILLCWHQTRIYERGKYIL